MPADCQAMLRAIAQDARETAVLTGRAKFDARVMAALRTVPRDAFVPRSEAARAYDNVPLPIGQGQTISQPYIVALMTDLLALPEGARVLEVGTGCGYQAAVLAELADSVYSIEIVAGLARSAAARLARLGYGNVQVRAGDGAGGWPEHAPFDGILVAAAALAVPPDLVNQLGEDRRLVIPLGPAGETQQLMVVRKGAGGRIAETQVLPVAFVPLTSAARRRA